MNAGHRWRGKYCDRKVPKNNHIFEYPWNLVWWQKATHISLKKISELKSDVRSCRCKNFSLKQVSGRIEGVGGPGPPDPPSGSATVMAPQVAQARNMSIGIVA